MIDLERDAPDLEDLAAYLDGRLSGERRASVEERLLRDEDYYEVYLETVQFLQQDGQQETGQADESRKVVTPAVWWRSKRAALLVVAATVVMAVGVWRLTIGPSPEAWIAGLDAAQIVAREGWEHPGWARLRSGNVDQGLYQPEELAFRIGVRTVDLRLALAADNRIAAKRLIAVLEDMTGTAELFGANLAYRDLLDHVEPADPNDLLTRVQEAEEILNLSFEGHAPEARSFALGVWTEAGRLAALAGDADVLADVFRHRREALKIEGISQYIKGLQVVVESEPGKQDFDAAEQAFEKIAYDLAGPG